jgi:hypothetical protein
MSPLFNRLISPLSCFQLTRSLPSLQERQASEPPVVSLSNALEAAGCRRLGDVLKKLDKPPFILSAEPTPGEPDLHQGYLRDQMQTFFSTYSLTSSTSNPRGRRTRPPECELKVHKIGEVSSLQSSHVTQLYWSSCAVRLSGDTACLAALNWDRSPEEVVGEEVTAIPATAGLTPSHAASLTAPVHQPPCEYVFFGDAGAVFSFCPDTFQVSAELSWSPEAYLGSLNALQAVGRWLIASRAVERAVQLGTGTQELRSCSTLLSKAYETVAQVGQTHEQPFLVSGLWGVAVLPRPKDHYDHLLQVGVVALPVGGDDLQDLSKLTLLHEQKMVIVNLQLSRTDLGFISMVPDKVSLFPLQDIEWHSSLPVINR